MQVPPSAPNFKPPWRNQQTRSFQKRDLAGASPAGGTNLGLWRNSIRARLRNEILGVQIPPGPPEKFAAVMQLADILGSEPGFWRFESSRPHQNSPRYFNSRMPVSHAGDGGATPSRGTKNIRGREDLAISAASRQGTVAPLSGNWGRVCCHHGVGIVKNVTRKIFARVDQLAGVTTLRTSVVEVRILSRAPNFIGA